MTKTMEEILGASIERQRVVSGTRPDEQDKVRYVLLKAGEDVHAVYLAVIQRVMPPIAKNGGAVLDGCVLTAPDGASFFSIKYHGDLVGWSKQIELGAKDLDLATGKIVSDELHVSDGTVFKLDECEVVFD